METITVDVIVDLFARYQLYEWWMNVGIVCSVCFGVGASFSCTVTIVQGFESAISFGIAVVTLFLFICSVIVAARFGYLLSVALKEVLVMLDVLRIALGK